jgi:hypothetical protein
MDRRWYLGILDILSLRGADCGTVHYVMVAKLRKIIAVSICCGRFNLRKLNKLEFRKQYQIKT